jgi:hypothetical protein
MTRGDAAIQGLLPPYDPLDCFVASLLAMTRLRKPTHR